MEILPGTRVRVFDYTLFKDDKSTPLSMTVKPGIVVKRYGYKNSFGWIYPDLVDIKFDHRPERISKGHFTDRIKILEINNERVLE